MSNGGRCCLLGICCRRSEQEAHIAKQLASRGLSDQDANAVAAWFADEIKSLGDLEEAVARMKREHKEKGGA
jgi:cytochrome c553